MPSTQQTGDTLLTYELATSPAPLQVSPETGPPSIGNLQFVISCPLSAGSVTVTEIMFMLPIGDPSNPDATDLTDNAIVISLSVSSSGTDQWQIGPGPASGQFALIPQTGQPGIINAQGLIVTISGIQVSAIVGTATITIDEKASDASVPVAQIRTCTIPVPKFPYGFNVDNFTANLPMIGNDTAVTLSWIGSVGASYRLLWRDKWVDVSKLNSWTSPKLTETTTFILQVSAQEAGQTVQCYQSVTVIVHYPNIVAGTARAVSNIATHCEGAYLEWNKDDGGGMTYLLNQKGSGGGGFVFGEVDLANIVAQQLTIDHLGNVAVGRGRISDCTGPVMPVGAVIAWAGTIPPLGWLICDGNSINTQYQELITLVGENTPNLCGRTLIGTGAPMSTNPAQSDGTRPNFNPVCNWPVGFTGGEYEHTLVVEEMPSHSHSIGSQFVMSGGDYNSVRFEGIYPTSTNSTGGSASHNTMQPYYAINYIIKC